MALETASYIANLVATNPDGGDQRSTTDDHIRLLKAVAVRTFPKLDAAVSLSAVQFMYLNDLSASVQVQFNTLRDGPATANFAVVAAFAQSASTAALIGTIPAARVPDLAATNAFTAAEPLRIQNTNGVFSFYNSAGTTRTGYLQMLGSLVELVADLNIPLRLGTNSQVRLTIAADGTVTIPGAIVGTISNATNAVNASAATTAVTANTANTAAFATSAGSAALLSGLAPSDVAGANTIAQRNSSGDLFARYLNQSSGAETNSVGHVVTMQNLDGYHRVTPISTVGQYMESRNITGRTGTAKTLSSSAPSGGSNGDVWYQY